MLMNYKKHFSKSLFKKMPYKQIFHNNKEYNNRFVERKILYEGEGMFDSLLSGVSSIASNAGTFLKDNKDTISTGLKLTKGIKSIVNTYDQHNLAQQEIDERKKKFDIEQALYRKIIDQQNQLKRLNEDSIKYQLQNPIVENRNEQQDDKPLITNKHVTITRVPSSLNNDQISAIKNISRGKSIKTSENKKGNGLKYY